MKGLLCLFGFMVLCALRSGAQQIIFMPNWTAQAEYAGYYAADSLGYYREEGLDVRIQHPTVSEASFSFLEKGEAQIVLSNLSNALTAIAEGRRIVNVMQTSQTNGLVLVSRFPLPEIESLDHQRIAVWNRLPQDLLDRLTQIYHLDVEFIRFNHGVNIFLSGAVDICLTYSFNEYPQLEEFGLRPDSCYVFRLAEHGYNLPEDGVYVREDYYNAHKEDVRKFVKASIRGWDWVEQNQEKALDLVMSVVHKNNIGTNRYHQCKMLKEILRLQYDMETGEKTYKLNEEGFQLGLKYLMTKDQASGMKYEDFVK